MRKVLNQLRTPDYVFSALEPGEKFVTREKCPTCGGWLNIVPCRLCEVRRQIAEGNVEQPEVKK